MKFKTTPEQRAYARKFYSDNQASSDVTVADLLSDLDAAQAQIAELERERDEMRTYATEYRMKEYARALLENETLKAQLTVAVEALDMYATSTMVEYPVAKDAVVKIAALAASRAEEKPKT